MPARRDDPSVTPPTDAPAATPATTDDPSATTSQVVDPRATQTPAEQSDANSDDGPTVRLTAPHFLDSFDPSIKEVGPITHAPAKVDPSKVDEIKDAVKRHNDATGDDVRIKVEGA